MQSRMEWWLRSPVHLASPIVVRGRPSRMPQPLRVADLSADAQLAFFRQVCAALLYPNGSW
jgi:hypothetical protein